MRHTSQPPIVEDSETATKNFAALLPAYFADYRKTVEQLGDVPSCTLIRDPNRKEHVFDLRDRLGEIKVPTLAMSGLHDFICGPEFSREMAAGIAGARLREFRESGHYVHIEEAEGFVAAVNEFIGVAERR